MENKICEERLRKEYYSTWRRDKKTTTKKNAPKDYTVLSLSTEDAQGKIDAISSILNVSAINMQFLKYLQKRSLKFFSCDSILKEEILFYLRLTSQMFREEQTTLECLPAMAMQT